jgi:hypothetical protein
VLSLGKNSVGLSFLVWLIFSAELVRRLLGRRCRCRWVPFFESKLGKGDLALGY